ncbi:MAG: pantoate--beta-alanine ligase [Fusobacteriota bacterium]
MERISKISELKPLLKKAKQNGKIIGLVPTMGFLHQGHLSLVKKIKKKVDIVVMSIFVNPTQFGEGEDLDKYPRDLKRDSKLSKKVGVDYLFTPGESEIYRENFQTEVSVKELQRGLCGQKRPGHFNGVTTIVTKLFNIVDPDFAIFGEKDFQQLRIIEQMVRDLNFDIKILHGEIIREDNGLAISSRNKYLDDQEKQRAQGLRKILLYGKKLLTDIITKNNKNITVDEIKLKLKKKLKEKYDINKIDYINIIDYETLSDIQEIKKQDIVIAAAIYVGKTRLIDNIIIKH